MIYFPVGIDPNRVRRYILINNNHTYNIDSDLFR
jgi:hypothetical protein